MDTLIERGVHHLREPLSPFASLSRYKILRRELEGLESDKIIPDVVGISADDLQRIVRNAQSVQGCIQILIPKKKAVKKADHDVNRQTSNVRGIIVGEIPDGVLLL